MNIPETVLNTTPPTSHLRPHRMKLKQTHICRPALKLSNENISGTTKHAEMLKTSLMKSV